MKPSLPRVPWSAVGGAALALVACKGETVTLGQAPPGEAGAAETSESEVESSGPSTAAPELDAATGASDGVDATSSNDAGPSSTGSMSDSSVPGDSSASVDSGAQRDASGGMTAAAPVFGEAVLVSELTSDAKDDNPTLTSDLLEIYFTSTRGGNADVYMAKRATPDASFAAPEPVAVVNTAEFDSSPAIDPDGLTLWVGSQRDGGLGGLDVWVSKRADQFTAWSEPMLVPELSSSEDDIPRPLGDGLRAMPLGSRRNGDDIYLTYLAERPSPNEPFAAPRLLEELVQEGANTIDGFLSQDGQLLLFVHAADDEGDLFIARREGDSFGTPLALDSVNTDADERDPWLSPDGRELYFSSDREGSLQIYRAVSVR